MIFKINNLTKIYHTCDSDIYALNNINVEIERRRITAIVGNSGSGKTTFLKMLGGLSSPDTGCIIFNGNRGVYDICSLKNKALAEYRSQSVGFVFQSYKLIPELSAKDNILLPFHISRASLDRDRMLDFAGRLGIADRLNHRPDQLSGGQKQRVAICRSLMMSPEVLLCDEPTGNLDRASSNEVIEILFDINKRTGTTIVLVTHDEMIAKRCDTILEIVDGSIFNQALK